MAFDITCKVVFCLQKILAETDEIIFKILKKIFHFYKKRVLNFVTIFLR